MLVAGGMGLPHKLHALAGFIPADPAGIACTCVEIISRVGEIL
jgi:hypothetical protein